MKENHSGDGSNNMRKKNANYDDKIKRIHSAKDFNKKEKYVKNYQNMNPLALDLDGLDDLDDDFNETDEV